MHQPPTRTIRELIDHPFAFTQRSLLKMHDFAQACGHRGVSISNEQLDALYRANVLTPLYRVDETDQSSSIGHDRPHDLPLDVAYRIAGIARARSTEYLYSPYQLLLLPQIRSILRHLHIGPSTAHESKSSFDLSDWQYDSLQREVAKNDSLIVALTVIEPVYRPGLFNLLTLPPRDLRVTLKNWNVWIEDLDPLELLQQLGCNADWLRQSAERLLLTGHHADPLRDWIELLRLIRPKKWEELRGDARIAIDHRVASELLLRFYEDLVSAGHAPALKEPPRFLQHPLKYRLNADRNQLDATLMDFGLSPHPALVLVLEGPTEMTIVPRVMDLLGLPRHREFIYLVNAGGIDTKLDLLASYVALPELGDIVGTGALLTRPATRFLVVVDPESRFATSEQREDQRQKWIKQIYHQLPLEHQHTAVWEQLDLLVKVETWDSGAFEFAHFTDRELAQGIHASYKGTTPVPLPRLEASIRNVRQKNHQNLKSVWSSWEQPHPTKVDIIDNLWPVLEKRIRTAIEQQDFATVPVVRVLVHAHDLATEFFRHDIMLRRE